MPKIDLWTRVSSPPQTKMAEYCDFQKFQREMTRRRERQGDGGRGTVGRVRSPVLRRVLGPGGPYFPYRSMSSRDQAGSRTVPRASKPDMRGLMSRRGAVDRVETLDPQTQPITASRRHVVMPSRFGRFLARCARIPTFGQSVWPRGWRASRSISFSATRSKA